METIALHEKLNNEVKKTWDVSDTAIKYFNDYLPNILSLVNEKFKLEASYPENNAIRQNLDFILNAHHHFGEMLYSIYRFKLWHNLIDESIWYVQGIRSRGLDERYFIQMLRSWMMSMQSYIKPPEVIELIQPIAWISSNSQEISQIPQNEYNISDTASELLANLFSNEKNKALELINLFFNESNSEEKVISHLLIPVLSKIGILWLENRISVADEHLAIANLRSAYRIFFESHSTKKKFDKKIIVCCVPEEEHEVGVELLSMYLTNKGWNILFVGHSSPEGEILRLMEQQHPFAIILSITLISHLPELKSLVIKIRERFPSVKILTGGQAVQQAREVIEKLVDSIPDSFEICNKVLKEDPSLRSG
jgi:MerR family transcriptional regulator, light-induced transcriptional regulator